MTNLAFDTALYKRALGNFASGVTVVTALDDDGNPRGFTASSFTSVSLQPPLISVCLSTTSSNFDLFASTDAFAVNILAGDQKGVSSKFASKCDDRFDAVSWTRGIDGSPLLDGCASWFDCRVHERVVAGDHLILIGQVRNFNTRPVEVLGYWRGSYFTPDPAERPALTASGLSVGAILEHDERVALVRSSNGTYDVPTGASLEPAGNSESLLGLIRGIGLDATLDSLYSVIRDNNAGLSERLSIYYRGVLTDAPDSRCPVELFPFGDIASVPFVNAAVGSMLRRFVKERQETSFGIYFGDMRRGVVASIGSASPIEI